ncbi:MAG: DUF3524 domain-containing protein [Deltaproteobacteria bacterium]|nr:MAG: DUF3524 domain-containing protein [Deltaproteobacteria bacterium]
MKFVFIEPFFGGSHRDFAKGLISHSRYRIELFTLPARFWKWRMRGAALYFAKKISLLNQYDGIITTNLMSLSDFRALRENGCPPALVYFHENQLTYPLAPAERMDYQFGFTDITTALAANRIIFNSCTHFDAFFSLIPGFIGMMPEYQPKWVIDAIRAKADVIYPGCRFPATTPKLKALPLSADETPLIIWNHRWEFDKNPEDFFHALNAVLKKNLDFHLALLGENFQTVPKAFLAAKDQYKKRIVRYGYEKSKEKYRKWLQRGAIVISTARQENFGISVVEAIRSGCIPLLPHRLSYPEIIPAEYHDDFLYKDQADLIDKLTFVLTHLKSLESKREQISNAMGRYAWANCIDRYDHELERLSRLKS